MSRYVIELRPDCKVVQQICESNGQVCIGARSIQYLEELTADYINEHYGSLQDEAYKRGINDGSLDVKQRVEGAYQKGKLDGRLDGQNETWECAKKIALMDTETSENVTGYFGLFRIMENLTPMQAIEKLKAYEEKQKAEDEIKVRDEVMVYGHCGVVTYVHDNLYTVMMHDGSCGNWGRNELKKTGKKHDIDKILEAMKE